MKKKYKITEDKYNGAISLIQKNGGKFYTDDSFSIKGVEGRTKFEDGTLVIVIDKKPWLASWSMIENELDKFFKSN